MRREAAAKLKGLDIDTCPFANLPERKRTQWALTREEMKNCITVYGLSPSWLCTSSSGNGRQTVNLRHSKFIDMRDNKDPIDVVRET
jgi:hypothetical protein